MSLPLVSAHDKSFLYSEIRLFISQWSEIALSKLFVFQTAVLSRCANSGRTLASGMWKRLSSSVALSQLANIYYAHFVPGIVLVLEGRAENGPDESLSLRSFRLNGRRRKESLTRKEMRGEGLEIDLNWSGKIFLRSDI